VSEQRAHHDAEDALLRGPVQLRVEHLGGRIIITKPSDHHHHHRNDPLVPSSAFPSTTAPIRSASSDRSCSCPLPSVPLILTPRPPPARHPGLHSHGPPRRCTRPVSHKLVASPSPSKASLPPSRSVIPAWRMYTKPSHSGAQTADTRLSRGVTLPAPSSASRRYLYMLCAVFSIRFGLSMFHDSRTRSMLRRKAGPVTGS
jgi:hypothetical protein